jgi:cysteinyl-tRNA synthetase, unknown class
MRRNQTVTSMSAVLVALAALIIIPARAQTPSPDTQQQSTPAPSADAYPAPPPAIASTNPQPKSWGYQLQDIEPDQLAKVPYDVIVIDYSRNGRPKQELTQSELARLKVKPDGSKRTVLAYMSIGEAESYRYYWKWWWGDLGVIPNPITAPAWRGKLNGEWGGNFAVRYWDKAWQDIIVGDGGYLDRIVNAGFDGVWLDKVDSSLEDIAEGRPTAKADMIAFIKKIGDRARAAKPGFLIFPQNGEALLADPAYRAMIDGFGKEDLLYGEESFGKPNAPASIAEKAALLRQLVAEGKPVLAVEYLDDKTLIAGARQEIASYGFIPHFGEKTLATMRIGDEPPATATTGARAKAAKLNDTARSETWIMIGLTALVAIMIGLVMKLRGRAAR